MLYNEKIFKRFFNWPMRRWYKNIVEIPRYFKSMHYLVKHGYDEYATWETFDWFIDTMKSVLTEYRNTHIGYPVFTMESMDDETIDEFAKRYDAGIDRMIELLDLMDECNPKYEEYGLDFQRIEKEKCEAKEEFFELFAEYFYTLWD